MKQKARHELKEFLIIVFYLWAVFGLFLLYKSLILGEQHISYAANGVALINALILGKFALIARALHLGEKTEGGAAHLPDSSEVCLVFHQQAVLQVLQKRWDPKFSVHSHGFRPGHSARQAVHEAQQYIAELCLPFLCHWSKKHAREESERTSNWEFQSSR